MLLRGERSGLPLLCPKPGVLAVPPDLTPPPPIACVWLIRRCLCKQSGAGGWGRSLQSIRVWCRFDKAAVSFAPARAAVPGAAERSGAGRAHPQRRAGGPGWSRRTSRSPCRQSPPLPRSREQRGGSVPAGLRNCCGNIAILKKKRREKRKKKKEKMKTLKCLLPKVKSESPLQWLC